MSIAKRADYPETKLINTKESLIFGYADDDIWKELVSGTGIRDIEPNLYRNEFFLVAIEPSGITVRRDAFCTLPIFYHHSANQFILSNRFEAVADSLKSGELSIDAVNLTELLLALDINDSTVFENVKMLCERTLLTASLENLEILSPTDRPKYTEVTDQQSFDAALEDSCDRWFKKAFINGRTAFEVSGGVDSATAAGYANRSGLATVVGSMEFPGVFGVSQEKKLSAIRDSFEAELEVVKIKLDHDYPLARVLEPRRKRLIYQYEEIYTEILSNLAERLRDRNVTTVFTGIGGDELFESEAGEAWTGTGPDEAERRRNHPIPRFYTNRFSEMLDSTIEAVSRTPRPPVPLVARSALFSQASRNNVYIEKGIWPIAPLADPTLYAICQGLPSELKERKIALRKYQERHGYPVEAYQPEHNEHFGPFFESSIKKNYGQVIDWLSENSVLAASGLTDLEALRSLHRNIVTGAAEPRETFSIFLWVTAELILQSAGLRKI